MAPRPPVHQRRRGLPEVVILRTRLDNLTPIEAAVLKANARCGRVTPRDIERNVRGAEDAHAILNRLVEIGLAARRADDRRGKGRPSPPGTPKLPRVKVAKSSLLGYRTSDPHQRNQTS